MAVLGGMLIDRDAVARAVEVVSDTMFASEANRRIYRAVLRLFERGDAVDVIVVSDELSKTEELEAAGGYDYLAELLDAVPTAANIEHHARIVRDKALLRRLIDASSHIIRDVYDQGERSVEQIVDEAEQHIFQVASGHDREGFVRIKELLWPAFEHIERLQEAKGELTGVATGFALLDYLTGGLQKGNLAIVAGRPSMGKTSWALNVARHAAGEAVPVGGVLPGDVERGTGAAAALLRRACGRAETSPGRAHHQGDAETGRSRRTPQHRSHLDRRLPGQHRARGARQGPPPQGGEPARAVGDRLSAADGRIAGTARTGSRR